MRPRDLKLGPGRLLIIVRSISIFSAHPAQNPALVVYEELVQFHTAHIGTYPGTEEKHSVSQ